MVKKGTDVQAEAPNEVEMLRQELADARATIMRMRAWHTRVDAFTSRMPLLAFLKDDRGRYVYVNKAFETVHGVRAIELLGSTMSAYASEELTTVAAEQEEYVRRTGMESEVVERRLLSADAEAYYLTVRFPVTDDLGNRFVGGLSSDVTAWVRAEQQLARSEKRYRDLVEHSQAFICTHDLQGRLLSVNRAAADSLGYSPDSMVNQDMRSFLSPQAVPGFDAYLERVQAVGHDDGVFPVQTANGTERIWQYHNVLRRDETPPSVLGYAIDITALKQAQDKLRLMSLTDDLTGLNNRRGFVHFAEQAARLAQRRQDSFLVLFIDVNGLKRVNDSLGHETGSRLLADVGKLLTQVFRDSDVLARVGGDEFAILVYDCTEDDAPAVISRLDEAVEAFNAGSGRPYELSFSVGAAASGSGALRTVEELLDSADRAMYVRKKKGGG